MSENEKSTGNAVCRKSSDLHTFCIALLTAIVVVAVYHVGNRMCRIFCPSAATCDRPAVTYMLVPVPASGAPAMVCHRGMPPFGGHPKFARGERHPGRKCFNPGPGPEGMKRDAMPGCGIMPKPCCKKMAPCDAPAPKPCGKKMAPCDAPAPKPCCCCCKKAMKPAAAPAPKAAVKPAAAPAPKAAVKPAAAPAPKAAVKPAAAPAAATEAPKTPAK